MLKIWIFLLQFFLQSFFLLLLFINFINTLKLNLKSCIFQLGISSVRLPVALSFFVIPLLQQLIYLIKHMNRSKDSQVYGCYLPPLFQFEFPTMTYEFCSKGINLARLRFQTIKIKLLKFF